MRQPIPSKLPSPTRAAPPKATAGRDMDMGVDHAVVLHDGSCIDDHVFANLRIRVDYGARQHGGAYSHICTTADNRGPMHDGRHGGVAGPFPDYNRAPRSIVADGRDDRVNVEFLPKRNRAEHRQPQECLSG
jgi:hypothetical protein